MGTDKYRLSFNGKAQYQYIADLLTRMEIPVYISCSRQQLNDIPVSFNIIADEYNAIGPMGGILSAMLHQPDASWLVIACDLPFISIENMKSLISNRNKNADITTFQLHERFFETTFSIYEPSAYQWVNQFRIQKNYRLQSAFKEMKLHILHPENAQDFMNINTPEDLEKFRKFHS